MKRLSVVHRANAVRELVEKHYQPDRQDRCKLWVYRNYVYPQFRLSESTFFRYLKEEKQDGYR